MIAAGGLLGLAVLWVAVTFVRLRLQTSRPIPVAVDAEARLAAADVPLHPAAGSTPALGVYVPDGADAPLSGGAAGARRGRRAGG